MGGGGEPAIQAPIFQAPPKSSKFHSLDFLASVLRFPERHVTPLQEKKLKEEIDFQETGHFWCRAVPSPQNYL
jgi:hypothetical protein